MSRGEYTEEEILKLLCDKNPLIGLPFNTKSQYVAAKTRCGCEVYIPVNSDHPKVLEQKLMELKDYLSKNHTAVPDKIMRKK